MLLDEQRIVAQIETASGLRMLAADTLGEMVTSLVAGPKKRRLNAALMARADYWTNRAARGWGGDRMLLLGKEQVASGTPVADPGVVWITTWDTEKDRKEFVTALERYRSDLGYRLVIDARACIAVFGSASRLTDEQLTQLLKACEFRQGEAVWLP